MRPEDVYNLTGVADPRLSPDGRTVAVTAWRIDRDENDYRSAIWLVPADGSAPPRQFTAGTKRDAEPRWSPDGTRLAFASTRDGDKRQVYVIPATGGEPRRLTDLAEDATGLAWSPDGTRLAFCSRVRDPDYDEEDERRRRPRRFTRLQFKLDNEGWTGDRRRQLFVVAADGTDEPRQLTTGNYESGPPTWSPDSSRLAFASARHDDWDVELLSDIYLVDAQGGAPMRLTACDSRYEAPSWSPDGSQIAVRWSRGGFDFPQHFQIAVVDSGSGNRRVLTDGLDRNCGPYPEIREPIWDGRAIVFALEDGGNIHVYRAAVDGSVPPDRIVGGERGLHGYDAVAGQVVHVASTPTAPPELYAGERRLTDITRAFRESVQLSATERFSAVSTDGAEVDAWIVRPAGFEPGRRYPTLLSIHGGPFTQYGNAFLDEFQVLAGAGYAVVYSNPRGSSGYSEAWGRAIRGPVADGPGWGSVDYDDLMAVMDEALRRFDFCDPDRLGVLGGSYGGYMTSWIVAHTDRFRAACSERAVNNLLSQFGSSDIGPFKKSYTGVFAFEDPEAYLRHSPTTYATSITTPLLIMHSENDLRCNVEQAEHLFAILRLLKRDVELVRFPAEGHELSRSGSPAHRVMRFETLLEWFARHLDPHREVPLPALAESPAAG